MSAATWTAEQDADGVWHIQLRDVGPVAVMKFETSCSLHRLPGTFVRNEWENSPAESERLAAFIVLACNSHDALVALVRAVTSTEFGGIECDDVNGVNWFDAREAAIAAAKEST